MCFSDSVIIPATSHNFQIVASHKTPLQEGKCPKHCFLDVLIRYRRNSGLVLFAVNRSNRCKSKLTFLVINFNIDTSEKPYEKKSEKKNRNI